MEEDWTERVAKWVKFVVIRERDEGNLKSVMAISLHCSAALTRQCRRSVDVKHLSKSVISGQN